MKQLQLPHKSYLHPMFHVFKNSSGKITKQVLCYNPKGVMISGKANHRYDAKTCGWQMPMTFIYSGPIFACRRCHRHIWSGEPYERCPQCGTKLNAKATALHSPAVTKVPTAGSLNMSTFR